MNLSDIRTLTRVLTNITVQDQINDTLLTSLVNESLYELYRVHGDGWGWTVAPLVSGTDTPTFDVQFHQVLVYRTASRMLRFLSDDTARSEVYLQEYQALIADMEKFYLSASANPDVVGPLNITQLSTIVRNLSGLYDKQTLSDGMLKEIVNVAFTEFANLRNWNEATINSTLPLSTYPYQDQTVGPAYYPCHYIPVTGDPDNARVGQRRVRSVYLVDSDGVTARQVIKLDSLTGVNENEDKVFYTELADHATGARSILLAPEQDADKFVRIEYYLPGGRIDTYGSPAVVNRFEIPAQFQMLLPYRAAQFVLMQLSPEDKRIEMFAAQYNMLLDAFVTFDQLNHDTRTFSIGERGKDDPRYVPWFKPA